MAALESTPSSHTTQTATLQIIPGLEVRPEHQTAIGNTPVSVAPGVGTLEIWTTFATIAPDQAVRGRLVKKRVARDEARRILELGRDLGARWIKGQALKEDVERLEDIACSPNADVLATAEAIAEIPARARAVLFHRCEQVLQRATEPVDLASAQSLVAHVENSDLKAPDFVLFTLIWLLASSTDRPNDDSVLHWVLRHEEERTGLTGIISQLDDLFADVTGRKTSSTIQSRLDRASALRFRVSMPVLGPQVVVMDPAMASPPPTVDPVATRSISAAPKGIEATSPQESRLAKAAQPLQPSLPPSRASVDPPAAAEAGPRKESVRRTASDDIATAQPVLIELKRTIEHLRRDVDILRRDLDNSNERLDYALKRLKSASNVAQSAEESPLSFDELASTGAPRRIVSDRLLLWIAIALLVGAVLVMVVRFVIGGSESPKTTEPESASVAAIEAETPETPPSQNEAPKPGPDPAIPSGASVADTKGAATAEPELKLPGEDPAAPPDAAVVPSENPAPAADPVDAEQPSADPGEPEPVVSANEVTAEEYGVGTQATHRLARSSKIFVFGQKLPVRVEELPGLEALIGECILTLANRDDYPRRIYPGYDPVRLSCAGSTKKVCEILGCEPQNSCVTAASMIKPCQ